VVDVADSVTYAAHDTDDSVKLGLVTMDELAEIRLVRDTIDRVHDRFGALRGTLLRKAVVHELIDMQVSDVLQTAGAALAKMGFESAEEARRSDYRMGPSNHLAERKSELEAFLFDRVYRHPKLVEVRSHAQNRLRVTFAGYCRRPALLPKRFRDRAETVGMARAVGDYLAGMTDHYCEKQYFRHFAV
jgi:dGTPase